MEVIQGEAMNQKSLIYVKVDCHKGTMDVYVGGKANVTDNINI
jgi:predicted PhzF superfamily epimerase YddE/YHI9